MANENELKLEKLSKEFFLEFYHGISDQRLRYMYGLSLDTNNKDSELFYRFCSFERSFAIVDNNHTMVGFLLDVPLELPESVALTLHGNGRTLAFAIFPQYQRKGYMSYVLRTYIQNAFKENELDYIHCGHFDFNIPCKELLSKIGFTPIGKHSYKDKTIEDLIISDEIMIQRNKNS